MKKATSVRYFKALAACIEVSGLNVLAQILDCNFMT